MKIFVLLALIPACVAAQSLSCVPKRRLGCGCSVRLEGVACGREHAQAHLFSEYDGAPLWLNVDGRETSVPSVRESTRSSSHVRGERWVDAYRNDELKVRIEYGPGKNTCAKPDPQEEDCEYFDVEADVLIRSKSRTSSYHGTGTCGC